ncbi:MAG: ribonuclease HIII [Puniceicoccales bacterium]|jgi:ribonuclease HIII|nr:ribonuclease HIII [Puniceicoccales bacterium]
MGNFCFAFLFLLNFSPRRVLVRNHSVWRNYFLKTMVKGNQQTCFTFTLSDVQAERLRDICERRGFEPYAVDYARYAFHGNGFNVIMYNSGKLVLQGKEAAEFVTFIVEPQITQVFALGNEDILHSEWFAPHAGLDESGKGDFFGPIVTACVIAGGDEVHALRKAGARDSKAITSDRALLAIEKKIREVEGIAIEVMTFSMVKYNELYGRFGNNLNRLLGWAHACTLGNALKRRYVAEGLLDQFSKAPIVQGFMKRDFPDFNLQMRTKAESDPVVATASIIARAEYVRQIEKLSEVAGILLPKGAGHSVIEVGRKIFEKAGAEGLAKYSKMHFKTFKEITGDVKSEKSEEVLE